MKLKLDSDVKYKCNDLRAQVLQEDFQIKPVKAIKDQSSKQISVFGKDKESNGEQQFINEESFSDSDENSLDEGNMHSI